MFEVKSELLKYFVDENNVSSTSEGCGFEHEHIQMKRIFCNDGFNISVQASFAHYCTPRVSLLKQQRSCYSEVEAGYPSEPEPLIAYWAEDKEPERMTDTVYPYVPVEIIDEVLKKHGGIKKNEE